MASLEIENVSMEFYTSLSELYKLSENDLPLID